jgi:soluble lytic murein transglycosylase-like protein
MGDARFGQAGCQPYTSTLLKFSRDPDDKTGVIVLICLLLWAADKPTETFQTAMEKQRAAMAVQREAVRKQAEMAAKWRATDPSPPECEAIPEIELTPLIDLAAQGNQVQTKLLRSVIERESANRPCAVSAKGAMGLMQLMPATAEQFQVDDPFDAKQNIEAGAKYLKQLLEHYKGDISLALAAYNAGPAVVDAKNGIPEIKETQEYVEAIVKKLK